MIKLKLKRIIIFTFLLLMALLFVAPVVIVIMNSFKSNQAISLNVFSLPNSISFVGWDNYLKGFTFGAYSFWLFGLIIQPKRLKRLVHHHHVCCLI